MSNKNLRPASDFKEIFGKKTSSDPEFFLKWSSEGLRKSIIKPTAGGEMDKSTYNSVAVMALELVVTITCPKGIISSSSGEPSSRSKAVERGAQTLGQQLVHESRTHDNVVQLLKIGLYEPSLRDELYVHVLKQLTDNPYLAARASGWLLLSLYLHCFPPSKELNLHIKAHLKNVLLPVESPSDPESALSLSLSHR